MTVSDLSRVSIALNLDVAAVLALVLMIPFSPPPVVGHAGPPPMPWTGDLNGEQGVIFSDTATLRLRDLLDPPYTLLWCGVALCTAQRGSKPASSMLNRTRLPGNRSQVVVTPRTSFG
jgi:hypothetical protein